MLYIRQQSLRTNILLPPATRQGGLPADLEHDANKKENGLDHYWKIRIRPYKWGQGSKMTLLPIPTTLLRGDWWFPPPHRVNDKILRISAHCFGTTARAHLAAIVVGKIRSIGRRLTDHLPV